jgi:hypothetical protein
MSENFHSQLVSRGYARFNLHIDANIFEAAEESAKVILQRGDAVKEYESSKLRETLEIDFRSLSEAMRACEESVSLVRYKDLMEGCSRYLMTLLFQCSGMQWLFLVLLNV